MGLWADWYIKNAILNVEAWLEKRGKRLKNNVSTVFPMNYSPELDGTEYLSAEDASYFMQQIGVLRWAVELGRINICGEVFMLTSSQAAP